jgi:murein DD-endopeptidase
MDTATRDSRQIAPAPNLTPDFADLIGKPFEWGGRGPISYDCYGLVSELLNRSGLTPPDYLSPQVHAEIAAAIGTQQQNPFWTACEPGPGAIATIRIGSHTSHVAFVLPRFRMIHAWHGSGVCVERLDAWRQRITGFYRIAQ